MARRRLVRGTLIALAAVVATVSGAFIARSLYTPLTIAEPDGLRITPLQTISVIEARILLFLTGVEGIPVSNAIDCYRMQYRAPGRDGAMVELSGLLALPRGVAPRRLVSFQHGTTTTRSAVPSRPDGTGLAAAIAFAGNGYALIAPDYPGLGVSAGKHPYLVADSIGPAIVAMIEAAQRVEGVPANGVFLSGFSEGGWATLAAVRILEETGKTVLGAAPVAGAFDLRNIALPAALTGRAPSHALYLAYAAWGQADWYGHKLDSVLTPGNAGLVERLFAGATPQEILDALPKEPRRLFNQDFLDALDRDGSHWFLDSFVANSVNGITPRAPLRLYYGSEDADVVPEEALAAERAMRARGADVSAIDVGPVGHDPSMLAAAPLILAWLRELEARAN